MDPDFWRQAWEEGRIGFHQDRVHPELERLSADWLDGASGVLVPLAGKSHDLPFLAQRVPTVGVELAERAVAQLHEEHGLAASVDTEGPFRVWRSPGLTLLEGDVFDLDREHVAGLDRVWDRAALVALRPAQRRAYVDHLRGLLPAGSRVLLSAFAYDPTVMDGPPHSVPRDEVEALYDGASVEVLSVDDTVPGGFAARGHAWWRRTLYHIPL